METVPVNPSLLKQLERTASLWEVELMETILCIFAFNANLLLTASLWEVELMETNAPREFMPYVTKTASLWEVELMETEAVGAEAKRFLDRFPLGSGINGNH